MTDIKINCRASAGYVTDPLDCAPFLGESYPHTYTNGLGYSFGAGYVSGSNNTANRSTGVDPRFAGIFFTGNGTQDSLVLRVDLPASGIWTVRCAVGDALSNHLHLGFSFWDNTTLMSRPGLANFGNTSSNNTYFDASGALLTSDVDWIANNVAFTGSWATTTFFMKLGSAIPSDTTLLAHLWLHQTPAGSLFRPSGNDGLGSGGPFFRSPLNYTRQPQLSLHAYYRACARMHRRLLARIQEQTRRAA